jgi:autotransporter-associated beta strand protein
LTAASAVVAATIPARAQINGTWIGPSSGNWSDPVNWVSGAVAGNGGTATFPAPLAFDGAPHRVTLDIGSVALDSIVFDSPFNYELVALAGPQVTLGGSARIHSARPAPQAAGAMTDGHELRVPLAGSAGLHLTGPGTTTLVAANSYSGDTTVVQGAILHARAGDASFGAPGFSIALSDGTIRSSSLAPLQTPRAIQVTGSGTLHAATFGSTTLAGTLTGSGTFTKVGGAAYVTAPAAFTGAVRVGYGSLTLRSGGAIAAASSVTVGGTLRLDNAAAPVGDRVGDTAPIVFHGGSLEFAGSASQSITERVGQMTITAGNATLVREAAAAPSWLECAGLMRQPGTSVNFLGSIGSASGGIRIAKPPPLVGGGGAAGTTNVSIIPWAHSDRTLVTYDSNGVRPLDVNTEYEGTFPDGVSGRNVRLTGIHDHDGAATVNGLVLDGTTLRGTGTVTVSSGAVVARGANCSANLDFGAAEGIVHGASSLRVLGHVGGTGGITKSGAGLLGLHGAANTYTGPTIVSAGTLAFGRSVMAGQPGPLGADNSPVELAQRAELRYDNEQIPTFTGTFNRDLHVRAGQETDADTDSARFGTGLGGPLMMNGQIVLDGPLSLRSTGWPLTLNGQVSGAGRLIRWGDNFGPLFINVNNTYAGGTDLNGGDTVHVGADSAFGTGEIRLGGNPPTLQASGGPRVVPNDVRKVNVHSEHWTITGGHDITFTGSMNLSGTGTVTGAAGYIHNIINTTVTTYAGELHDGGLTKAGPGLLVLAGDNAYLGSTVINAGTLALRKTSTSNAWRPVLDGPGGADVRGGALVFDYAAATSPAAQVLAILDAGYDQTPQFATGAIRSSTATALRGLGWLDDPASSRVTVAYTRYGDANLDRVVNLDDFNRLAANFGSANAVWTQGDFNYDGNVNLQDFNRLASNFGLSAAEPEVTPQDWSALAAAVPEPAASLSAIVTAMLPVLRRRSVHNR